MAATVVPNLTNLDPNLADSATGWVGASGGLDTEVFKQGTGSWTYQTPKNGVGDGNFSPAAAVDMSATGIHIYWIMKCDVMSFGEDKLTGAAAPSGLMLKVSSSGGSKTWHISGANEWDGKWQTFVADVNNTSELYAEVGTLDLSAVTTVSWLTDISNSGNIRIIDNTWIDAPRYGTGLTAYGTDFSYSDIEAIDQAAANKYGVIELIEGNLIVRGGITIDDNGATSTFNSTGEDVTFSDLPVGADLYKLAFTGAGTTAVIDTLAVKSFGTNANTRFDFDASGTVGALTLKGSSINRAAFSSFKAGQNISSTKFNNSLQVDPSSSIFSGNTVASTADTVGAMLWPATSNTSDVTFSSNTTAAAIEIATAVGAPFDFSALDFVSNTFDVNNTSGSTVSVNKLLGSNPSTYTGSLTLFQASFTLTLEAIPSGVNVTIVNSSTRAELQHSTSTGADISYGHSGGETADILLMSLNYDPNLSDVYDLSLPNSDSTIKFQALSDSNYENV